MAVRSLPEAQISGRKVLVRVDFNMELSDIVHIQEGYRIMVAKKTIDFLFEQGAAKVALVSHFGRPEGKPDPKYSLQQVKEAVGRVLERPVFFVDDCIGEKVNLALETLPEKAALLLENVRFYPEEEANNPEFAKALSAPYDLFVNEAFSASHRAHASIAEVPLFLPSFGGFRLLTEIKNLATLQNPSARPAIAIIGGAKIETKLPLIRAMEQNYDCVLVGGKVANEALDQGLSFSEKVLLPQDFDSDKRLDIGPTTAAYYTAIIKKAKTIVWNGPMGKFEEKPFDFGTNMILQAILESEAFVVIGGGESLAVVEAAGVFNKIGFVSSGGGAMLEYLSGETLPGLKALEESREQGSQV